MLENLLAVTARRGLSPSSEVHASADAAVAAVGAGRCHGGGRLRGGPLVDEFGIFVFGALIVVVLIFLAIGKYYPGSGAEQVDWNPTRSIEDEVRLELDDVDQMIEAQNERRRASGRAEISEEGIRAEVQGEERWRKEQAERYTRGSGPGEDLGA